MADTVTGTGEANAVLFGHGLDVTMVVCVFKACLQGVVVDIRHGKLCFYALDAHGFQLQISHRARGVLRKGLVDAQTDLRSGDHFARNEMIFDDLLCESVTHFSVFSFG